MNPSSSPQAQDAAALARVVAGSLGVAPAYRHAPKEVEPGEPLVLPTALLKWYEVHSAGRPVPPEIAAAARKPFTQGRLSVEGLGFVVLHRCGESFYFLIACTWRNENEIWQTVWYKDGDAMREFAPFPRPSTHLPTFCVWELVPVWSEQQSWVRFLSSARDEAAAARWLAERYQGAA